MRTRGAILLASIITGLALGYTVTNIGFGDYAELNRMFTFQDLRMFLSFMRRCGDHRVRVRSAAGPPHPRADPRRRDPRRGVVRYGLGDLRWVPCNPDHPDRQRIPACPGQYRRRHRRYPAVPLGQRPILPPRPRLLRAVTKDAHPHEQWRQGLSLWRSPRRPEAPHAHLHEGWGRLRAGTPEGVAPPAPGGGSAGTGGTVGSAWADDQSATSTASPVNSSLHPHGQVPGKAHMCSCIGRIAGPSNVTAPCDAERHAGAHGRPRMRSRSG